MVFWKDKQNRQTLARLRKKEKERAQTGKIRNEKGNIKTDTTKTKGS